MHRQLRRAAIVSTSAAVLLGIAGIQAGLAQAAVDTPAPSPALISQQTAHPVSMSITHVRSATPLATSSAPRPADSQNTGAGDNGGSNNNNYNNQNNSYSGSYSDGTPCTPDRESHGEVFNESAPGFCKPRDHGGSNNGPHRHANGNGNHSGTKHQNGSDKHRHGTGRANA